MKSLIQIFVLSLLTFSTLAQSDSLKVDSTKVEEEATPSWEKTFGFRLCWCFHQQATVRFVGENTNKGEKIFRGIKD